MCPLSNCLVEEESHDDLSESFVIDETRSTRFDKEVSTRFQGYVEDF